MCVGQFTLANANVTLQKTHFGWILGGSMPDYKQSTKTRICNSLLNLLNKKIAEFWEIENGPHEKMLSNEATMCEEQYVRNTQRNPESGHYIVRLPFKENVGQLGESYGYALKRLLSQKRILAKNSNHRDQYNTFMKEYEELGHMSEDTNAKPKHRQLLSASFRYKTV